VEGVWASHATAGAAPGAGPAGAGVRRRLAGTLPSTLALAAASVLVGATASVVLAALPLPLLFLAAFSGAVGAGTAGAGAEPPLAAGVIRLAKQRAAVLAVSPDPGWVCDHLIVTS
jgi:hypothetical protein